MNDRQLLLLAAKAAGILIVGDVERYVAQPSESKVGGFVIVNEHGGHSLWNPLKDDGDALQLAVRRKMELDLGNDQMSKAFAPGVAQGHAYDHSNDPYDATRRAIVCAAAAWAESHR